MPIDFQIIESLLWTRDNGYYLLDMHIERLTASARHFGVPLDPAGAISELEENASGLDPGLMYKVRLLLYGDGNITITSAEIPPPDPDDVNEVTLAKETVDSSDEFLYHKTTRRQLYDRAMDICRRKGLHDMIFRNERGELTECAYNNLVLKIDGTLYTPPVSCGLLNGVYRRTLLSQGTLTEKVLTAEDIPKAKEIYCCNSVRGMVQVDYVEL